MMLLTVAALGATAKLLSGTKVAIFSLQVVRDVAPRTRRPLRDFVQGIFGLFGCEIVRLKKKNDPLSHMRRFVATPTPMIFDVGANVGQSAVYYENHFPGATIHSFEPSPTTFEKLKQAVRSKNTSTWNVALGSSSRRQIFLENSCSDMSSLLPMGERCWGQIEKETEITVTTLDEFCAERGIQHIDILKIDTQGYDLEVFKGARRMLELGQINMIFFEVNFSPMYKGAPAFDEIFQFLNQYGYHLQNLYGLIYWQDAIWTDALFMRRVEKSLDA